MDLREARHRRANSGKMWPCISLLGAYPIKEIYERNLEFSNKVILKSLSYMALSGSIWNNDNNIIIHVQEYRVFPAEFVKVREFLSNLNLRAASKRTFNILACIPIMKSVLLLRRSLQGASKTTLKMHHITKDSYLILVLALCEQHAHSTLTEARSKDRNVLECGCKFFYVRGFHWLVKALWFLPTWQAYDFCSICVTPKQRNAIFSWKVNIR